MQAQKLDFSRRYSVEEYLAFEEQAETRHEYWNGWIIPLQEIVAMAGGLWEHSTVKVNSYTSVASRLRGQRCQALDSDMQVQVPNTGGIYVYPDMSIVCEKPQFTNPAIRRQLLNPSVIVEVLSAGTAEKDRSTKFEQYVRMPSMREYVLVSTDAYRVESLLRQDDGSWSMMFYTGLESVMRFRSIGLDIPLTEIYERVELPPSDQPPFVAPPVDPT